MSSGQQKRRRSSSSSRRRCDAVGDVNRNDLNEDDEEDERAIHGTDKNKRRSELLQDDATAAAGPVAAAAEATSSNGTLTTHGGGRSPSNKWELTPISILLRTMSYMDNTTLMVLCLVCQQIRDLIWSGQGMETELVRIFELSPSINCNFDDSRCRVRRFVSNMNQYFQNVTKTRILQGFQHWKVEDVGEFDVGDNYLYIGDDELERLTNNIRMPAIVSLDMSSSLPIPLHHWCPLHRAISFMVPNLLELDFSHTMTSTRILGKFAVRCPRLEIIRWNYNVDCIRVYPIDADGRDLQSMNNLKELYLDNWCFNFDYYYSMNEDEDTDDVDDDNNNDPIAADAMSDNSNYPDAFLFHSLSDKPLERISIRNARCTNGGNEETIPQSILLKFVRKAPATLVWFRSDLTRANIQILQSERPGIQLLN